MENLEKPKVLTGQISHTVNIYRIEYNEAIRSFLETICKEELEKMTCYEIENFIFSFIQNFISGVETERLYENATSEKFVFLNFYFPNKEKQSWTIAYILNNHSKDFKFIN